MASLISVVPRLDDKTALEIFRALESSCKPQGMTLDAVGMDHVNLLAANENGKDVLTRLERSNSFLVTQILLTYPRFSIQYVRNQDPSRISPFYDEIKINQDQQNTNHHILDQKQRLALIDLLNSKITLGNVYRRDKRASSSVDDIQSIYHSTVLKLETSFAEQIEKITNWTVDQTSALEKHKLELAKETAAERERLSKEYAQKVETLRLETEALEVRRKELDDRDHMHARRALRSDIQKIIKDRQQQFSLTPETRRLRLPVHIALITLLGVLAVANYVTVQTVLNLNVQDATLLLLIWAFGKQAVVTLAFVGTLFFYVRWMNRWFEQHASAEFMLKQFELDIDRASWAVETAMDWGITNQSAMPSVLLEGVTRNLFANQNVPNEGHSAADDLASALVGNASQMKLKMGDNELSFDRKGLAGLNKTSAQSA